MCTLGSILNIENVSFSTMNILISTLLKVWTTNPLYIIIAGAKGASVDNYKHTVKSNYTTCWPQDTMRQGDGD